MAHGRLSQTCATSEAVTRPPCPGPAQGARPPQQPLPGSPPAAIEPGTTPRSPGAPCQDLLSRSIQFRRITTILQKLKTFANTNNLTKKNMDLENILWPYILIKLDTKARILQQYIIENNSKKLKVLPLAWLCRTLIKLTQENNGTTMFLIEHVAQNQGLYISVKQSYDTVGTKRIAGHDVKHNQKIHKTSQIRYKELHRY
jgi:hypothetical protein